MTMTIDTDIAVTETEQRLMDEIASLKARLENATNRAYKLGRDEYQATCDLEDVINMATFEIDTPDYILNVRLQSSKEYKPRKTRIYTSGSYLDAIEEQFDQYYVPFGDERPEYVAGRKVYRKAERNAIKAALDDIGIIVEKLSFSQKAGCSMCSCSPGFIADSQLRFKGIRISSIDVTVTAR